MKSATRMMWSLGDYQELARMLAPHADALAEACGIQPGVRVLDVGAGTGNFAVAAPRRAAKVVASDLTPQMVECGLAWSKAEALDIEWHEADAEALSFGDAAFDVVASVRFAQLIGELNRAADGRLILDSEYLLVVARKAVGPGAA